MNIYLDIDGTLIDKQDNPAIYLKQFLEYMLPRHELYWLTTHCRQENGAVEHVMDYLSEDYRSLVEQIKPAYWETIKTEGIDSEADFRWLDDCLFEAERQDLIDLSCADKHYLVELDKDQEIFNPGSELFKKFFNENI